MKLRTILIALAAALMLSLFSGCQASVQLPGEQVSVSGSGEVSIPKPSNALLKQIAKDRVAVMKEMGVPEEDLGNPAPYVEKYYGAYGDCAVVMMSGWYFGVVTDVTVADSVFHYGSSATAIVWRDGKFHSLQEAYMNGMLTKEQIATIAQVQNSRSYLSYTEQDA